MAKKNVKKAAKKAVKKALNKGAAKQAKQVAKKAGKKLAGAKKKAVKKVKDKKNKDLMCFLTTACVYHYGLPDNCYELQTLRRYRDSYLMKAEDGRELVNSYYQLAPKILSQIEKAKANNVAYPFIFTQVQRACAAISQKQYTKAKQVYLDMVNKLRRVYLA